jgi:hypothetical protein
MPEPCCILFRGTLAGVATPFAAAHTGNPYNGGSDDGSGQKSQQQSSFISHV